MLAGFLTAQVGSAVADSFITIGTAGVTGVYYPAGGAICRLVNRSRKDHGIRCTVESTSGSIYNLSALKNEQMEIGIAQSDWVYHAMKGTEAFKDAGTSPKLRALFSLHSEPFTVLVGKDSGIQNFDQIRGRRVNIGNVGSGGRASMEKVMAKKGWRISDLKVASELRPADQGHALCDGKVDAVIYTAGHPNAMVQDVTMECGARIINVSGKDIDELLKDNPFYSVTTIPAGMYPANPDPVETFGAKALVVTTSDLPDETAYQVVKAVFDNLDDFKTLHPVFATLEEHAMLSEGIVIPFHNGALKYFKEKGLLDSDGKPINKTLPSQATEGAPPQEVSETSPALPKAPENSNQEPEKNKAQ